MESQLPGALNLQRATELLTEYNIPRGTGDRQPTRTLHNLYNQNKLRMNYWEVQGNSTIKIEIK